MFSVIWILVNCMFKSSAEVKLLITHQNKTLFPPNVSTFWISLSSKLHQHIPKLYPTGVVFWNLAGQEKLGYKEWKLFFSVTLLKKFNFGKENANHFIDKIMFSYYVGRETKTGREKFHRRVSLFYNLNRSTLFTSIRNYLSYRKEFSMKNSFVAKSALCSNLLRKCFYCWPCSANAEQPSRRN